MPKSETAEVEQSEEQVETNGSVPMPGGVNLEELKILYQAAEIKVRGLTEQLEARDRVIEGGNQLLASIMMRLGVDHVDKIVPAIVALQKNRKQRRLDQGKRDK